MEYYYDDAQKLGKKEYRSRVAKGEFPYLPVLDQILQGVDIRTEQKVGLITIPLEFVTGTRTVGRTMSFASNFMPIMAKNTEFAAKWNSLANAQVTEGIRDAVKVYEYLNRYYALEGNKRISVLKFFEAEEILADVTRLIPRESDDPQIKCYYEWMHFTEITDCFSLEFSKNGMADQILEAFGKEGKWDDETKADFGKIYFEFRKAYEFKGGKKLPITLGDAMSVFLGLAGCEKALKMGEKQYQEYLSKIWNEFLVLTGRHAVDIVTEAEDAQIQEKLIENSSILSLFLPGVKRHLKVAFLYPKDPETSDWLYAHELGRNYLQETFPKEVTTSAYKNVTADRVDQVMEEVIADGADIIFATAPQMRKACLTAALAHPNVKILNCSLNTPHPSIRTYYARMYEGKFLSGMVAGALAENGKVGYIADYPLYGMIANINAFALGVASVNPRAKVYLDWSTRKNFDKAAFLKENDIQFVSDQDMVTPSQASRQFGLYQYCDDGVVQNLVMPIWNWGVFYESMIRRIMAGEYANSTTETTAFNYWWGMSAGVIDVICSKQIPASVMRLVNYVRRDICEGRFHPFFGEIYDQNSVLRNEAHVMMKTRNIMKMDYLVKNVVGNIPDSTQYIDDAKPVIKLTGVEEKK